MADRRPRRATGAAVRRTAALTAVPAAVLMAVLTGCSDGDDRPPPTPAQSAAGAASRAASAASSLASEGSEVLASATAEAGRWLEEITEGVDVRDDVTLGKVRTGGDGRATVEVGARNTTGSARSFAVQVDFTDRDGNLLDTVVVMVDDVPPGETGRATARSTHDLAGDVRARTARAVRY